MLTDSSRHSYTDIGVYVYFADSHFSSLTKHILGDTDSIGHLSAVLIDPLDVILIYRACAVENDRETGKLFADFFKNVKAELRLLTGLKLICAVACTDSNCKRINACSRNEIKHLLGLCEGSILCAYVNRVLDTGKSTKLALNNYAVSMSIFNYHLCKSDILFIGKRGTVYHNRSKSAVYASLAGLKIRTVIKVKGYRKTGLLCGSLNHSYKIIVRSIFSCACGNLKNYGRIMLFASSCDTLDNLHIVDVESAYCIAALISLFEHFCRCYQWH